VGGVQGEAAPGGGGGGEGEGEGGGGGEVPDVDWRVGSEGGREGGREDEHDFLSRDDDVYLGLSLPPSLPPSLPSFLTDLIAVHDTQCLVLTNEVQGRGGGGGGGGRGGGKDDAAFKAGEREDGGGLREGGREGRDEMEARGIERERGREGGREGGTHYSGCSRVTQTPQAGCAFLSHGEETDGGGRGGGGRKELKVDHLSA